MNWMLKGVIIALLAVACSKKNTIAPPPSGDSTTTRNDPGKTASYREDTSFKPTGDFITLIAVQKDGKILIANPDGIGRINRDGTKDNSFAVSSCGGGQIHCIALQDNGQILLGGSFLTFNGSNTKYLVRLNPDGSRDNAVSANSIYDEGYTNEDITSIALMKDGRILIGGDFFWQTGTTAGGTELVYQRAIVCLKANGSFDPSWKDFAPRAGYYLPYYADAIKVMDDGKVIIAGNITFNDAKGKSYFGIVRLNPDETVDTAFAPDFGIGKVQRGLFRYSVLSPLKDGSILMGGSFDEIALKNGTTKGAGGYLKMTGTGGYDLSFGRNFAGEIVDAICPFSDSIIFMGDRTDSTSTNEGRIGLVAIKPNGDQDASYNPKLISPNEIYTIIKESDSTILIAGSMMTGYQNGQPVYKGLSRIIRR